MFLTIQNQDKQKKFRVQHVKRSSQDADFSPQVNSQSMKTDNLQYYNGLQTRITMSKYTTNFIVTYTERQPTSAKRKKRTEYSKKLSIKFPGSFNLNTKQTPQGSVKKMDFFSPFKKNNK